MNSLKAILSMIRREGVEGSQEEQDLRERERVARARRTNPDSKPYPIQIRIVEGKPEWVPPEPDKKG
jgi:hypothetical protein